MQKIKVEACCGSVRDVIIANELKVDQIELNSSLENGGMTPSIGTLIKAKELTDIPIYTMVRARPKGFNYCEEEFQAMLIDAKNLCDHGADGIVFGFLNDDATINVERVRQMVEVIGDKEAIFHKAFDSSQDLEVSIQQLIDLKVDRILTGGGLGDIMDNLEVLKTLEKKYGSKIEILVGGGVTSLNVKEILEKTKVKQIHFTGKELVFDQSTYTMSKDVDKDNFSYIGVGRENMRNIINEVEKVGK